MKHGNLVYSTNKNLKSESEQYSEIKKTDFTLSICFEKKGRGGKGVTIIKGFKGNKKILEKLGKEIKIKLGIGGSNKNEQIILQGRIQEKIIRLLNEKGYKTKKVGG